MKKAMPFVAVALFLGACHCKQPYEPVVSQDAWFEQVSTGHQFTEGPAWDGERYVYFSDVRGERIIRFDTTNGREQIFRENTGRANGLAVDHLGRLYACEGGNRRVTRISNSNTEVLASNWGIHKFNSPNDIAIDTIGGVYFTDPRYGNRDNMELSVEAVYYRDANGNIEPIITNLVRPNGLVISHDGRFLYVVDNGAKNIWVYNRSNRTGKISNGRVFAWMDPNARGGGDGMTVDRCGNVYCAGQGAVWIWNSKGQLLHRLKVPENPTNVTLGGPSGKDLYVTAQKSLYRTRVNTCAPPQFVGR